MEPIAYEDALRDRIASNIAGHERRVVDDPDRRRAAVAIVVVDSVAGEDRQDPDVPDDEMLAWVGLQEQGLDGRMVGVAGGAAFLLCRRTARLNAHARQWALPGGRLDDGETAIDGRGGSCTRSSASSCRPMPCSASSTTTRPARAM